LGKSCQTIKMIGFSLVRALGKFPTCQHDRAVTRKAYESHEVKTVKNLFVYRVPDEIFTSSSRLHEIPSTQSVLSF